MNENKNEAIERSLKTASVYIRWIAIAVLVVILLSGVTFVKSNEVALIFRFGQLVGNNPSEQIKKPGLHFALPYIIDKVVRVPVKKIQEVKIDGLYTAGSIQDITKTGYAITGDSNIILANAVLKYKIKDPIAYAVSVEEPDRILQEVVTSSMVREIATMKVDDVLTNKKKELVNAVIKDAQGRVDEINLGIQLVALEFTNLQAPSEVKKEFDLVTSTYVKNETLLQKAESYKEKTVLGATTKKNSMIQEQKAAKVAKVAQARLDVAMFQGVIEEYEKNPKVVHERIYREEVEKIMKKVANTIVVPKGEQGENIVLP